MIILDEFGVDADRFLERASIEALEERPAMIGEHSRLEKNDIG